MLVHSRRATKCLLLTVFLPPFVCGSPWESISEAKEIRLATDGAFAPMNFKKNGVLTGFDVEIATAVAQKLGLKASWKTSAFESLLVGLSQNRYDLVAASLSITPERAKAVDFTDPYYCTGGIIVTLAGGAKTAGDLKNKVVVVQTGSAFLEHMKEKNIKSKQVKTLARDTDAMQALLSGRADVWITDKFVAIEAIKAHPQEKMETGELVFQDKVAMAVSKGNTALREKVNRALSEIMTDGSYQKISQKYFQQDISCH